MNNSISPLRRAVRLLALGIAALLAACSEDDEVTIPGITLSRPAVYLTAPSTSATVPFSTSQAVGVSLYSMPKGWTVTADFATRLISVTSPAADDEEAVDMGSVTIHAYSASGTSTSTSLFVSRIQPVDLTAERSNCFVITRCGESYSIPVVWKGESGERIAPAAVELLWQSPGGMLQSVQMMDDEHVSFHVPGNDGEIVPGNALLAARNAAGEVLWTWHVWVTDSAPREVDGYMDRNLGAAYARHETTTEILRSYGTYYQWGRMTPFVGPYAYNCSSAMDAYMYTSTTSERKLLAYEPATAATGTADYAVSHPLVYLLGTEESGYDWHFTHDDTLWSASSKSLYDPCPKGWRVADSFDGWEIADDRSAAMAGLEAQFGWNLARGEAQSFFLGGGRRSWLYGQITNVNTCEVPKPWIGCYWTAASATGHKAEALYFTLDTEDARLSEFDPARSSERANGMQVRCVRE